MEIVGRGSAERKRKSTGEGVRESTCAAQTVNHVPHTVNKKSFANKNLFNIECSVPFEIKRFHVNCFLSFYFKAQALTGGVGQ